MSAKAKDNAEVTVMEETMKHDEKKISVPLWEKYALTVSQATEYFGIGDRKLRKIIEDHEDANFILMNGDRTLIKRKLFEDFLNRSSTI